MKILHTLWSLYLTIILLCCILDLEPSFFFLVLFLSTYLFFCIHKLLNASENKGKDYSGYHERERLTQKRSFLALLPFLLCSNPFVFGLLFNWRYSFISIFFFVSILDKITISCTIYEIHFPNTSRNNILHIGRKFCSRDRYYYRIDNVVFFYLREYNYILISSCKVDLRKLHKIK